MESDIDVFILSGNTENKDANIMLVNIRGKFMESEITFYEMLGLRLLEVLEN